MVKFSSEMTSKLHAAAKRNGRTLTPLMGALTVLALSKAALSAAGKVSEERYKDVSDTFLASEHYLINMNPINHVSFSPDSYTFWLV